MSQRTLLHRFLSLLVLISLLSSTLAPVAHAQDAGPGQVFLPVVAGAAQSPNPSTSLLFRTHVTVKTPAQWRDLDALGVTQLERGDDWALLLVDDAYIVGTQDSKNTHRYKFLQLLRHINAVSALPSISRQPLCGCYLVGLSSLERGFVLLACFIPAYRRLYSLPC